MFYIVDSVTGKVYDGFAFVELPSQWLQQQQGPPPPRVEFHPNSRLFKINGCPNARNCGFYDSLMVEGRGLKLLSKQLRPQKDRY